MKSGTNELKNLANLAKQSLMRAKYSDNKSSSILVNKASNYLMKSARNMRKIVGQHEFKIISSELDVDFVNKVKQILADNYPFDTIGRLCDEKEMANMNEFEREQYIFSIMDKYHSVVNEMDLVG